MPFLLLADSQYRQGHFTIIVHIILTSKIHRSSFEVCGQFLGIIFKRLLKKILVAYFVRKADYPISSSLLQPLSEVWVIFHTMIMVYVLIEDAPKTVECGVKWVIAKTAA